ncbi:MAG TPA: anthranilate phosphoribosyltransferase, partial [Rhizomicrobium sp.]|nr:anthranilate phosphoribosyltransferase [Rhizomicrobium sp.]
MSRTDFWPYLEQVQSGKTLDYEQADKAFAAIMSGKVAEDDLADFLLGMSKRRYAIAEIVGGVRAMRAAMRKIRAPANAIDLCGTGGDGHNTFNISTATGFVVAACGVPVAKHGNRSASSRSGTADVLEVLGVKIDLEPHAAEQCLAETNFCFLFAPHYHTAMKYVAPVRKQLGIRTIFNLLGPLSNPAGVKRQLIGVFDAEWIETLAQVLDELGSEKAWLVHGADGLDELTTTKATHVAILDHKTVSRRDVVPEEIGVTRAPLSALKGGDAKENAAALLRLLGGEHGPFRDIVLLNAAAALVVADKVNNLKDGALMAADAI